MNTKAPSTDKRFSDARRKLILGTLSLPLVGLVARRASADKATGLTARIEAITAPLVGKLGFSAQRLDGGPVVALNANERFPMASLFKIPIALAALRRVQVGNVTLGDLIKVPPEAYVMSPVISTTFIHPGVSLSLANLIEVMITHSDNTATDVVQKVAGGPGAVTAFLKEVAIQGMTVDRNTAGFMKDFYGFESGLENIAKAVEFAISDPIAANAPKPAFEADMRDQSTPKAMMDLLAMLARGKVLNPELTAFILGVMSRTSTGPGRIKGLLPRGTPVAHKTGTIGGVANDAGLVTLPDGGRMVLAVFTKSSATPVAGRDRANAETARSLYDHFAN
jgi:beta-lactamase class A